MGIASLKHGSQLMRIGASLIELLVVLFIIGIMMSLLLPALQNARNSAQDKVCQNNIYQLHVALSRYIDAKRMFPDPHRWPVDTLKWMEQRPLADLMKDNYDPNAVFPRPPLLRCPMQEEFPSRVATVDVCHYVLTVTRNPSGKPEGPRWEIHDRQLLDDNISEEPWYIGPEISHLAQQRIFTSKEGPHTSGLFMTRYGLMPQ
ncbi:type II secretion system protein [Bythopirellula goksoeyrii]|uniref:Type II secretion system protein G n=1 Tax=Bythopirellula goksoeyrii TaxID=1400387 RepID=A0A5B9Q8J0_9BACT|nr:type II secretion system protein [Bythopirellula goksoeyrii]QEG33865.1 hypothetical protein Pr1d_11350 [Bythopirellula goksoeyrii]